MLRMGFPRNIYLEILIFLQFPVLKAKRIMVPEHSNHAKENELFDAKPHVDASHDHLVQMVMELIIETVLN